MSNERQTELNLRMYAMENRVSSFPGTWFKKGKCLPKKVCDGIEFLPLPQAVQS